jgi:uncharacterized membrane protein
VPTRKFHWLTGLLVFYILVVAFAVVANLLRLRIGMAMTIINTLTGFSLAFLHTVQQRGWKRALILWAFISFITVAFESIGVLTGVIYGPYHYTDQLGFKLFNLVPLLIPVAWFMVMAPALVMAETILNDLPLSGLAKNLSIAALGALIMTSWDVTMDPIMVKAGHWVWDIKGAFFGIPLQNYWGWWLTSFVALSLSLALFGRLSTAGAHGEQPLPLQMLLMYAVTGLGTVISAFMIGLPGPAWVGLGCMSVWVIWASMVLVRSKAYARKSGSEPGVIQEGI